MDMIINRISNDSNNILILGRNNFDIDDFVDSGLLKRKNDTELIYEENKNLNIKFISVHKSKGLEEDNVILINLENSIVGFPNQMMDDDLLNFVISDSDQFPYCEERRLFYVALTRTKNNTYLLVPQTDKSEFVVELEQNLDELEIISKDYASYELKDDIEEFMQENNVYSIKTKLKCPVCKTGDVLLKIVRTKTGNDIVKFFDCSHRKCVWKGGNYYSKLELLDEIEICPECETVRYVADGKYGSYWRCKNKCKAPKLKGDKLKRVNKILDEVNTYEYVESDLNCPKCGKGNISLKINSETKKQQFCCSNTDCDFNGGFSKINKSQLKNIKICPECGGILVLRNGKYGEFYSCNSRNCKYTESFSNKKQKDKNYAETKLVKNGRDGKISNKKTYKKKTTSNKQKNSKQIKTKLKCPVCGTGDVILNKNTKTGKGYFNCSNESCNWDGGPYHQSEKFLDSLDYCTVEGCNGLTFVKNGFKACTYFVKTNCDAGRK